MSKKLNKAKIAEAMDRVNIFSGMVEMFIVRHDAIKNSKNKKVLIHAEQAADALADLYQALGNEVEK